MPNAKLIPCIVSEIPLIQFSLAPQRTIFQIKMPGAILREKYPDMDWRAADKVTTWKLCKRLMKVIFMADQVSEERQYALILVAGGEEAYNHWDTLEETMANPKEVD